MTVERFKQFRCGSAPTRQWGGCQPLKFGFDGLDISAGQTGRPVPPMFDRFLIPLITGVDIKPFSRNPSMSPLVMSAWDLGGEVGVVVVGKSVGSVRSSRNGSKWWSTGGAANTWIEIVVYETLPSDVCKGNICGVKMGYHEPQPVKVRLP